MKKLLFIAYCLLFVVNGLSAQGVNQGKLNAIVDQFNQNSPRHKVNQLATLGDELMLLESFDDVASKLCNKKNGFRNVIFLSDGSLKAESDICELYAVNRQNRPERIDTLTLYVKHPLDKDAMTDSLNSCNYVFKQTSSDGRFDWWQHKVNGINLAVYYKYSKKYASAMLFARPKKELRDIIPNNTSTPVQPTTPAETEVGGDEPVTTPMVLTFEQVQKSAEFLQRNTKMTVNITFPSATGDVAGKLNSEALRSHLLGFFVETKPRLADDMSIEEGLNAYLIRMKSEFLRNYAEVGNDEVVMEHSYHVALLPEEETREGVITYVNTVTINEPDMDPSSYRIVSNFDAKTGKLLTFEDVFKKNSKATVIDLLKRAHLKNIQGYEEFAAEVDYEELLKNFILKRDSIEFILVTGDESGPYEELFNYKYEKIKKYLR